MGQAFRRASGRIRANPGNETTSSTAAKPQNTIDRRPPPVASAGKVGISDASGEGAFDAEGASRGQGTDNVLEEKDQRYDAMLSQMVGRITSKPGGKPEMGEAFVVERYNRPMPKLRNTKPDSGRYEERPVPAGTLNVAQIRRVILLYAGKADDQNHKGPMEIHQIAEKFRVDVAQIQKILQFTSLPPEECNKEKNKVR